VAIVVGVSSARGTGWLVNDLQDIAVGMAGIIGWIIIEMVEGFIFVTLTGTWIIMVTRAKIARGSTPTCRPNDHDLYTRICER
jgi:cytochrome c oxidase assembly factor CtaG